MTGGVATHVRRSVSVSENEPGPSYVAPTLQISEAVRANDTDAALRSFAALSNEDRPEVLMQLMQLSCRRGFIGLTELCLGWGAPPDTRDPVTGNTVWHLAAAAGHATTLELLITKLDAAAVNEQLAMPNADGRTPLLLATRHGHVEAVTVLCRAGADPNLSLPTFAPPLFCAIENRRVACARALLDVGANPNSIDRNALSCRFLWRSHEFAAERMEEEMGGRGFPPQPVPPSFLPS